MSNFHKEKEMFPQDPVKQNTKMQSSQRTRKCSSLHQLAKTSDTFFVRDELKSPALTRIADDEPEFNVNKMSRGSTLFSSRQSLFRTPQAKKIKNIHLRGSEQSDQKYKMQRRAHINPSKVEQEVVCIQRNLNQYLNLLDLDNSIEVILDLFVVSVNQDDLVLLLNTYKLISSTFINFGQWEKALLFLDQARFICNLTRMFTEKIWVLFQLSLVAKKLKQAAKAKIFIKKALQYAWYIDNRELELNAYEELGILSVLDYQVEDGKIFHDIAVNGQYEQKNSLLKAISKKDLDQFIVTLPPLVKNIDGGLTSKSFNFPFKLIPNDNPSFYRLQEIKNIHLIQENLKCTKSGRMVNIEVDPYEQLNEILRANDFEHEFPNPIIRNFEKEKHQRAVEENTQTSPIPKPQKVKRIRQFSLAMIQTQPLYTSRYQAQRTFHLDNDMQKRTLQGLVTERETFNKIYLQHLFSNIIRSNLCINGKNPQLRLTHLTTNRDLRNYEFNKGKIQKFSQEIFQSYFDQLNCQKT